MHIVYGRPIYCIFKFLSMYAGIKRADQVDENSEGGKKVS